MIKSDITIKIIATLSKIMGSITLLAGLYKFVITKDGLSESILVIGIGAGMIGYKQYLTSKIDATKGKSNSDN